MIISHKHKFIFLKTIKTAGTSIQAALAEHCGEEDIITGDSINKKNIDKFKNIPLHMYNPLEDPDSFTEIPPVLHHEHVYLSFIKQWLGSEIWNNYFKFAFIRNPFDLAISKYYWDYKKRPDKVSKVDKNSGSHIKNFRKYIKDGQLFGSLGVVNSDKSTEFNWSTDSMGKETYEEKKEKMKIIKYEHTFYPWLCDGIFYDDKEGLTRINPDVNPYSNGIDIDFVGRYENLDDDINRIGYKLGLKLKLPQLNANTRDKTKKINEYYDEETAFYIENYYKYDLDRFWKKDNQI